jgi:hypothetical protein
LFSNQCNGVISVNLKDGILMNLWRLPKFPLLGQKQWVGYAGIRIWYVTGLSFEVSIVELCMTWSMYHTGNMFAMLKFDMLFLDIEGPWKMCALWLILLDSLDFILRPDCWVYINFGRHPSFTRFLKQSVFSSSHPLYILCYWHNPVCYTSLCCRHFTYHILP